MKSPSGSGRAFLFLFPFVCVAELSLLDHCLRAVYPQTYPVTQGFAGANMAVSIAGTPCLQYFLLI